MSRIEFAAVISRFRISFQLTGFILFVCLAHADDEQPIDLKSILQESAVNPPAQVHFREQRHNPMLKEPLVLTGVLEYVQLLGWRRQILGLNLALGLEHFRQMGVVEHR